MATTKTLTPTNQAITLAAFTEKPDNRTNVTNDDKLADAVNSLNSNITSFSTGTIGVGQSITTGNLYDTTIYKYGNICVCNAYINGMSGISDRTNFNPFVVPEGFRPAHEVMVGMFIKLNSGLVILTKGIIRTSGRIDSNYSVTGPDAPNVYEVHMKNAVWGV